jgi:glycosyltransferase involved in cell wall biosynthesis
MKVIIRAPLLSISGYGIHSRQIYEWLESIPGIDITVDIVKWGMTAWDLNTESQSGLIGRIMNNSKQISGDYDLSIQVQLPDEWDNKLAKTNIGVSAFVETDRCNPAWVNKCNEMNQIIVPSSFTKSVVKRSGIVNVPIHVIPEWFNENIKDDLNPLKLNLNPKFNFLMIGTITGRSADNDRKNLYYSLKWFCETFKDNKKVGLVLKTSFGKGTTIDRKMTIGIVDQLLSEVRIGKFPKVTVLHGNMTQKEIASIYNHKKIKCLLAPTRGEGYGLPIVEAAASGMPVVATGWSGHTDFLKEDCYAKLAYKLKEISDDRVDGRIFMKGTRWAEIEEKDFKEKILDLVDNYDMHQERANSLKEYVVNNFDKNAVIKSYTSFFNKHIRKV